MNAMTPLQSIIARARDLDRHILLPEAGDPRIREAAAIVAGEGIARVTLLDPRPEDLDDLVAAYHDLRRAKADLSDGCERGVSGLTGEGLTIGTVEVVPAHPRRVFETEQHIAAT